MPGFAGPFHLCGCLLASSFMAVMTDNDTLFTEPTQQPIHGTSSPPSTTNTIPFQQNQHIENLPLTDSQDQLKFTVPDILNGCRHGGIDTVPQPELFQGNTFISYNMWKFQVDHYYSSGAKVFVGGMSEAIVQRDLEVAKDCPFAVLQAYAIQMENLMAVAYFDNYSEIVVQQKRLSQVNSLTEKFRKLYDQVLSSIGEEEYRKWAWQNIATGYQRMNRYLKMFWEDVHDGQQLFQDHLNEEKHTRGNMTDADFAMYFRNTLVEVKRIFEQEITVGGKPLEWWPIRGTLIALMRYGASQAKEDEHPDLKENDIDLAIGVTDEQEWGQVSQKITRFLEHWDKSMKCFVKTTIQQWQVDELIVEEGVKDSSSGLNPYAFRSEDSGAHDDRNLTSFLHKGTPEFFRKDLLYCVKQKPVTILLDITSYIKDYAKNIVYGHRTFTDRRKKLETPGDLHVNVGDGAKTSGIIPYSINDTSFGKNYIIHPKLGAFRGLGDNYMSIDEVAPSDSKYQRCKAFDFFIPCPKSPDKTLHAMLLESGREKTCFALPIKKRLKTWVEEDWRRFLAYQQELVEAGAASMLPYLKRFCDKEIETYAPESVQELILNVR